MSIFSLFSRSSAAFFAGGLLVHAPLHAHTTELDTLVVSGASQQSIYDTAQPVTILNKDQLDANSGNTLGTLLSNTPGIANADFGAGVGRPVIRGMSGSRVKILQNGSDASDLSAMSSDHAPMAEASSAEQIEIIYGPSTLIYGGGAIGGVVNLIDRRIHEQPQEGVSGDVNAHYSSVDQGYNTNALIDFGHQNWTLHLEGFKRDADNYRSGRASDAPKGYNKGRIGNSDSNGQGGAVALSWADADTGFFGASISTLEYDYGVPNLDPHHEFRVVPKQTRYDIKGAWRPDASSVLGWIEEWRTELSFNDYEHAETEPGLNVGLFDQESWELQSRIRHRFMGEWSGTFGLQAKFQELALCHDHDGCVGIPSHSGIWNGTQGHNMQPRPNFGGYAYAHDTPMPTTKTLQTGIFIVEQRDWAYGTLELGARIDHISIEANPDPIDHLYRQERSYYDDKTFTPTSLSAAATWILNDEQRLGFSIARVQRAPEASELYWNGDHHATFAFQLDNPELSLETAYTFDLNWLYQGERDRLRLAAYVYHFNDYIYNDLKPYRDPFHGDQVYRHEQLDARFYGAEASWQHNLNDAWHVDVNADFVRAETTSGDPLPRTPPASLLVALNWERNGWDARAEAKGIAKQSQTAATEDSTAGFILLNLYANYRHLLPHGELKWQVQVQNLTNEYTLNHVSYLKDHAPLPGRNVQFGVRYRF